jgi:hypothetical protein
MILRGNEGRVVTRARTDHWPEQLNRLRKGVPAEICPTCRKSDWLRDLLIPLAVVAASFAGLWFVADTRHEQSPSAACAPVQTGAKYANCFNAVRYHYDRPDPPQP